VQDTINDFPHIFIDCAQFEFVHRNETLREVVRLGTLVVVELEGRRKPS
jgi:hypothetical protein